MSQSLQWSSSPAKAEAVNWATVESLFQDHPKNQAKLFKELRHSFSLSYYCYDLEGQGHQTGMKVRA